MSSYDSQGHGHGYEDLNNLQFSVTEKAVITGRNCDAIHSSITNWKNIRRLKIEACEKILPPSIINDCRKTLVHVEFSGPTVSKNIITILGTCSKLEVITFSYVTQCHSDHHEEMGNRIDLLRKVHRITFYGVQELTRPEIHVLHYLRNHIKFDSLRTLTFATLHKQHPRCGIDKYADKPINSASTSAELFDFIGKHMDTLKCVEIRRPRITLLPSGLDGPTVTLHLQNLTKLTCDLSTNGVELLLTAPTKLTVLHCYNSQYAPIPAYKTFIACVQRCRHHLECLKIDSRVKLPLTGADEENNDNPSSRINYHDLSHYEHCTKLLEFNLIISMQSSGSEGEFVGHEKKTLLSPGAMVNCSKLSVTQLTKLSIRFDTVSDPEMDGFASLFPLMRNIKFFLLHGNSSTPYKVRLNYVQSLVGLPKIMVFELCFCHMEDINQVEQYRESTADLEAKLAVTPHSVIYWRSK